MLWILLILWILYAGGECAISPQAYCGSLPHIWSTKRPASRKSVMPHSGRILWRDVIPSAVRGGGPRRAYRTRGLRMRHGIIFRSRTDLWLVELSVLSMLLLTIVYSDVKWCWGRIDNPSGQISYWGHRNVGNLGGFQFHGVWSVVYVQKNLLSASMTIAPYGQCKVAYYL